MRRAAVAAAGLAALAMAACGSSTPTTARTTTTTTAPTTSTTSSYDAMRAWAQTNAPIFATVVADAQKISTDGQGGNVSAVASDCQKFQDDLQTALALPAIPDPTTAEHWHTGLSDWQQGAEDCVQGIDNNNVSQVQRATEEITNGGSEIQQASQAVTPPRPAAVSDRARRSHAGGRHHWSRGQGVPLGRDLRRAVIRPHLPRRQPRRQRLLIPVFLGVLLVVVPTVFAVFPSWADWPAWSRSLVLIGWLGIAVGAVWLTSRADRLLHEAVEQDSRSAVLAVQRAAISDQFRSLLVPWIGGLPEQYHLTVYGPTPDQRFLIPVFPPALSFEDPAIFPSGAGATGKAWESPDGTFVVTGEGVSSSEHGLTAIQQRRYRMFATVAATVIRGARGTPIGVLTAIGREDDGFFDDGGVEVLAQLADGLAWLIPQAVEWMMPREDG